MTRHAAQEERLYPRARSLADHDEVRAKRFLAIDNPRRRVAALDVRKKTLGVAGRQAAKASDLLERVPMGAAAMLVDHRLGDAGARKHAVVRNVVSMEGGEYCPGSNGECSGEGLFRARKEVHGHEYVLIGPLGRRAHDERPSRRFAGGA